MVGVAGEPATEAMLSAARRSNQQQTVVLFKPEDDSAALASLAPFTQQMHSVNGGAAAYVCQNFSCREPLVDVDELETILRSLPD